ncbi:hypothetical protein FAVG1_11863 [Fusarium avenaceum]|nr:hypothetical protein FAVG1_11863 [Fusarium avenaceum]
MEVVGAVAAIVQLVGTAKDAFKYIDGVKGSAEDRQTLFQEVSILQSLVAELDSRISLNLSTGILPPPQLKEPLDQGSAADLLQRIFRAKTYMVFILQQDIWSSTSIIKQNTALIPAMKRQASHIESGVEKLNLEVDGGCLTTTRLTALGMADSSRQITERRHLMDVPDQLLRFSEGYPYSISKRDVRISSEFPSDQLVDIGKGKQAVVFRYSALILQHLQQKHSASVGVRIAGVFCNYKEKDLQTPANLLAGIWRQLAYDRSPLSDEVVSLYDANAEKGTRPSFNETASVLTNEINKLSKAFVVIDAIDECGPNIVPSILRILDIPRVNILLTSRLPGSGPLASDASLSIQPSTLDMRLYVESRLSESSLMSRHCEKDPSLRDEVVSTITSRASGMFLMARYHTDLVLGQDSIRRVRQALISLPHDLNSAYAGILERIYSQEPHKSLRSRQLIAWVLFSTRPLTIEETRCALSVEPGDSSLNQDGLPDLDALLLTCSGIISINTESRCVAFVHQTIAEYLMQAPPVPMPTAHLNIARTCITYLLFDTFSGARCLTDTDLDARLSENLFFLYAAQNWGKHTKLGGEVVADLGPLIKRLLLDMGYRESSLQGLVLPSARYEGYSWTTPKHAPPLWLAAFFGLPATTYLLLRDGGCLIDAKASDGSNALSIAAKFGYTDVMTILVDRGAELGGCQGAAIPHLEAARYGKTDALSLLLDRGADIDGKPSNGRTALHEAVSGGHDTTLTLLKKGADVNAMTINRWTVLHSAVAARQEEFVVQLLHHGATVNTQTSEGETALHIAASRGFDSIISRLMDANATPELIDINGDTALHTAASRGFMSVCSLLIQSGSTPGINAQNLKGETPIYQAAMAGHVAVIEFLLEIGANCELSNSEGILPLHQAAWEWVSARWPRILWKALSYYKDDPSRYRLLKYMLGQASSNKDQVTALDEALENSHTEVAAILQTASPGSPGIDFDAAIDDQTEPGVESSIEKLLSPPFPDGQTGGAYKRIRLELKDMLNSLETGAETFALPVGEDLKIWEGVIMGPVS